jgi:hypothetical protein
MVVETMTRQEWVPYLLARCTHVDIDYREGQGAT